MKAILIPIVLLVWPSLCSAGGDFVSGMVTDISGNGGKYVFRFVQTDDSPELMKGCRELMIVVEYERVPWFSWLPFVNSGHPSRKETDESVEYLEKAKEKSQTVNFGYMGYGLVPTSVKCSFKSKGLRIIDDRGIRVVFSYYDQI